MNTKLAIALAFALSTPMLCTPMAAPLHAQSAGEIVVNGDFETIAEGAPTGWGLPPQASLSSEYWHDGKNSLKIVAAQGEEPHVAQDIYNFASDKKYRLQYRVRGDKFGIEYRVYIGMWRKQGEEQIWISGADTGWRQGLADWQHVKADFTPAPGTERLMLVVQLRGPATAWFDSFSIAPAPEVVPPAPVKPFVGSSKFVQITKSGRFRVAGKPFYPLMLWGRQTDTDELMQQARRVGYNIVAPTVAENMGVDGTLKWLDMARRNNLMVMLPLHFSARDNEVAPFLSTRLPKTKEIIAAVKNHPALFMHNIADEPAWGGADLEAFAKGAYAIREADPNHPIFINHAPRNSIAEIRLYNYLGDITGSDIYPVWNDGIDKHSDLPNKTLSVVGDEVVKNLQAADFKKPVIQTLQAFAWSDGKYGTPGGHPFPTAAQLRFMAYDSIAAGANGIAFFQDHRYENVRPELTPILAELNALSRILASSSDVSTQAIKIPDAMRLRAVRENGNTLLILTNKTAQEVNATLDVKPLKLRRKTLHAVFENRAMAMNGNTLSVKLAPFSAMLLTDAKNERDVLLRETPSQAAARTGLLPRASDVLYGRE